MRSLVLQQPDFTFLKSREFFLSETASCDQRMNGVKLLKARYSPSLRNCFGDRLQIIDVLGLWKAANFAARSSWNSVRVLRSKSPLQRGGRSSHSASG